MVHLPGSITSNFSKSTRIERRKAETSLGRPASKQHRKKNPFFDVTRHFLSISLSSLLLCFKLDTCMYVCICIWAIIVQYAKSLYTKSVRAKSIYTQTRRLGNLVEKHLHLLFILLAFHLTFLFPLPKKKPYCLIGKENKVKEK